MSTDTQPFECSRDELERLLDHEDPLVRKTAEVVLEERYGGQS